MGGTQDEVQVAAEKVVGLAHEARPAAEEFQILPVVRLPQLGHVMAL
jgi:hypothetical protein